jgi:predicted phosphodiesterase
MRIGIITDIHDEVEKLTRALAALQAEGVDAVVSLGDATDLFGAWECADEVAALFAEHRVVGVWGNHDYGLTNSLTDELRARFRPATIDFMATIRPTLELGGCHFSHVEPWLDPTDPRSLWSFDGQPEEPERLRRSFAAIPHRLAFIGHFHRWFAATEDGPLAWRGESPLALAPDQRYLVVVGPLFRGAFAVLDTDAGVLAPLQLSTAGVFALGGEP